jgi:hypothetical protein
MCRARLGCSALLVTEPCSRLEKASIGRSLCISARLRGLWRATRRSSITKHNFEADDCSAQIAADLMPKVVSRSEFSAENAPIGEMSIAELDHFRHYRMKVLHIAAMAFTILVHAELDTVVSGILYVSLTLVLARASRSFYVVSHQSLDFLYCFCLVPILLVLPFL